MEKLVNSIKLMAKAGLFFANCDGNFSQRERDFIEAFLQNIQEVGDIEDELKNDINDSLNHTYTIEGIIEDTKQLVDGFNEDERKAILFTMAAFIEKVITADGNLECKEQDYFLQWRDAVVSA
jgi:tellurite resistance protein